MRSDAEYDALLRENEELKRVLELYRKARAHALTVCDAMRHKAEQERIEEESQIQALWPESEGEA